MDAHDDIAALLAAARSGAPDALGRIFEAARGHLLHLAERDLPPELRPKIGPSDLVQETAIEMHRGFAQFTGTTPEECFSWLRAILRNNTVDVVRHFRERQKRTVNREVSLSANSRHGGEALVDRRRLPDASAIRREEVDALALVLPRLPKEERLILDLRYGSGLSFAAIAVHMNLSPKTVRKLWYRAVARAQQELANDGVAAPAEPRVPTP